MHRSSRLSAAVLATALVGTLTPAVTAFGTPTSAHATVAADRGTADVRVFQDSNHDNSFNEGEPDLYHDFLNKPLTVKNKATGKWYIIKTSILKDVGLPAGDYTLYLPEYSTYGNYVFIDATTGKRLARTKLANNVPAIQIGSRGQEITGNGATAGYGVHSYVDIKVEPGKALNLAYAASSVSANVSAVETKDGAEVAAPDAVTVAYKDGSSSVKSANVDDRYWAGAGDQDWSKHHFFDSKVTARISPKINYTVDKVEARFHQFQEAPRRIDKLSDPLNVTADPANHTYTVNSSDAGEAWGDFEYKAFLKPVEVGKATVRLFGDENVDNKYSGPEEKVSSSYINLEDENGRWFKVTREALEKQGLPAGKYTAYVRNASVADGFGVVVDSATGKRMEIVRLDDSHDATYVDANSGETLPTVTDKGRFVKTSFTVAPDKDVTVDLAFSRIDASAKVTVDGEAFDSKVYFKDGDARLESFVSKTSTKTEHLASDDADKKTRHFFSDEWVTVGVEGIDGHKVKSVTVGGFGGGKTVEAEKVSDTEYRVKRSVLGDDFGRLKFDVQLEKVVPTGKVNFRLYGDENLNNSFDEDTDKLESRYVNLVDEQGNWYKVMPEALAQQGLPAGKYTVYMRDASVADGFGVVVDSDGKRLPFAELKGKKDATYIDAKTGEKAETTTDEGRFVTTEIEIKENETVEANFASTRIDATAKVTADGEAVDSKVYFKDGEQRLETYKSDSVGYVASDDAGAKTRHFFSEEWVTVGVEEIDGYTVKGVTVRGFGGGKTVEAEKVSDTEYRIKRSEMGDDFGRFEFDVQLEKTSEEPTPEPTPEPTEEPTPEPTEEPTEAPTEEPTEEPTEAPTEEPTPEPTDDPTEEPTPEPTPEPTEEPTEEPTPEPTDDPTEEPTPEPTEDPTEEPTPEPTDDPTEEPTPEPTEDPTVEPTPEPNGKVNFRLFRDENLDNKYSGDAEEVHDGYVNLVDEQGNWYKVMPDSLAKQGLPAGKYTVYMRDGGLEQGNGIAVDAQGNRLQFTKLEEQKNATYIDADTGEKSETTTDTGTFVVAHITVKANESTEANFATTQIDASANVNTDDVESVYFKDGDQRLDAYESESGGFVASDDAEAKKRHFFSGDKVTLGVNVKDGRKVTKVEVKPSATNGGDTIVLFDEASGGANAGVAPVAPGAALSMGVAAQVRVAAVSAGIIPVSNAAAANASAQEFSVDRSKMGDDFGRFEFVVTTAPVDDPTPEPTEEPSEAPSEQPTEEPSEQPTEEPTEGPTQEPTEEPSEQPTEEPSEDPTDAPSEQPTDEPSEEPSEEPTEEPTDAPSEEPSEEPTEAPSEQPTEEPSEEPSEEPTDAPSEKPGEEPTDAPSEGGDDETPGEDGESGEGDNGEGDSGDTDAGDEDNTDAGDEKSETEGDASDNKDSDSSKDNSPLPRTGVNVGVSLAVGVALVALGAGLVFRRRKN